MPQVTDFSASQVPTLLQDLEAKWESSRANQAQRFKADTNILQGVFAEQTADLLDDLTENDGCKPVKVVWLETGDHTVEEENDLPAKAKTAVTCDIDGPEAASSAIEYEINDMLKVTLKVQEKDCGNHFMRSEKLQHLLLTKQVGLVNKLAQKMTLFMAGNAGESAGVGRLGTYQGDGSTAAMRKVLRVAPGNLNAFDFAPYVAELAEINRLNSPAVFDGGNLRYALFNAEYQQNTPAGDAGQQNHFDTLRAIYRDGLNFGANSLADSTFIVEQGALALFTAAFFPTVEEDIIGDGFAYTTYRTPIFGLTQAGGRSIEADTTYMKKKLPIAPGSTKCEIYNIWEMRLWYLPLVNPQLSANNGVNGIIRVKSDATLTQKGTAMQKAL
ncbi:hypothetical protein GGR92_004798 [Spirosoma lacussanchae]|uniref:hypothetical protein n=1 Tax=Spirosoma lacussanchae TaxID=1884249 RepID=UPI001109BA4E|nr:hypothetical protein [Spirosoma lacussanchae]